MTLQLNGGLKNYPLFPAGGNRDNLYCNSNSHLYNTYLLDDRI